MKRLGEEPKGMSPVLQIRLSKWAKDKLKLLAKKSGQTPSEFARNCLEKCIGKEKMP